MCVLHAVFLITLPAAAVAVQLCGIHTGVCTCVGCILLSTRR